jgi:hypothetical protein
MTNDISFSIIMMYPLKLMKSYLYNKQINETIEKLLCVACGVASYFIEAFFCDLFHWSLRALLKS